MSQPATLGRGANHAFEIFEMNAHKAIDPICGMEVDPATALSAERGGPEVLLLLRALPGKVPRPTENANLDGTEGSVFLTS